MMREITSRENQHLKFASRVRDGSEREWVFVEGLRLVEEASGSELEIARCFVADTFGSTERERALLNRIETCTDEIYSLPTKLLRSIADTENPQGIIAIAARPISGKENIAERLRGATSGLPLVVLLTEVNNPLNLGAVIRSVEAAGAAGIITTKGSVNAFGTKSLRASMGSAFRLPVWENAALDEVFEWADAVSAKTVALDTSGKTSIFETDWRKPTLLIAGSEAHGLHEEISSRVTETVYIPIAEPVESLNLAVSCSIALFEACRQNTK